MSKQPFSLDVHHLDGAELVPVTPAAAHDLARRLASIPPWSVMNYPADGVEAYLNRPDPASRRFTIMRTGVPAGIAAFRWPWLRGPYLEMLGLTSEFQGQGLGALVMDWMETQGGLADARWLWLLASSFNSRAIAFYTRRGFETTARLDDLVADGFTEILMRKRCAARKG